MMHRESSCPGTVPATMVGPEAKPSALPVILTTENRVRTSAASRTAD
jgi:hypothetical protein